MKIPPVEGELFGAGRRAQRHG